MIILHLPFLLWKRKHLESIHLRCNLVFVPSQRGDACGNMCIACKTRGMSWVAPLQFPHHEGQKTGCQCPLLSRCRPPGQVAIKGKFSISN